MSFTAQDVEQAFEDGKFESYSSYRDGGWYSLDPDYGWDELDKKGRVTINGTEYEWENVADIGGMDEGSYAAIIFRIGDRLFRKEGFYQSHYGTDWDGDFSEVEAYEKTVTDYRPV